MNEVSIFYNTHAHSVPCFSLLQQAAVLSPPPHPYATSSISAPPTSRPASSESWKSHAVNRSSELLSCARTALKIGQSKFRQRQRPQENGGRLDARSEDSFPEWLADVNPAELQLYQPPINSFYNQQQSSGNSHWNCSTQQLLPPPPPPRRAPILPPLPRPTTRPHQRPDVGNSIPPLQIPRGGSRTERDLHLLAKGGCSSLHS